MTTITKDHLQVTRILPATREKLFEAWTRAEILKRWFCPEDCSISHMDASVKLGGRYSVSMICNGKDFTAYGHYQEILLNQKLVFTHGWAGPDRVETLVTVEFRQIEGGTELTLTQERFLDPDEVVSHQEGWISALENLAKCLA
jgi:uncharacterized protein YndB with AHSA1/START domain